MATAIPDTTAIGLSAANFKQYVADIAKAVEDSSRAQREANLKSLESFTKLTTGVGKLSNGIAQFAFSGRKDVEEFATALGQIAGFASAIEGVGLTALGAAQRLHQMTTAASAASAAQSGLAAAGVATTASMGAIAIAALKLGAALGALAGGYYLGTKLRLAIFGDEEKHAALLLKTAAAAQKKQDALYAMKMAEPRAVLQTAAMGDEADRLRVERDHPSLPAQNAQRANRLAETVGVYRQFRAQEKIGRDFNDPELVKAGIQGQINAMQRALDIQRNYRNSVKETVQERMRELDAQNRIIQQSREALKQEQARVRSMEAAFAKLNPVERDEIKQISAKARRGEQLTEVEIGRLERSHIGPLQNFAEEQNAARGRAERADFYLAPFEGKPLRGRGSEEQRLETEIAEQTKNRNALALSIEKLKQEDNRLLENLIRQIDSARRETARLSTLLADTTTLRNSAF